MVAKEESAQMEENNLGILEINIKKDGKQERKKKYQIVVVEY